METTDVGRAFVEEARLLLRQAESLERRFAPTGSERVVLKIAAPHTKGVSSTFADLIHSEVLAGKIYELSFVIQNNYEVIDSVYKGAVNLGVINYDGSLKGMTDLIFSHKGIEFHPLFVGSVWPCVLTTHHLAGKSSVTFEMIRNYTFLVSGEECRS